MALSCGALSANITVSCTSLPTSGTTDILYLINDDDLDRSGSTIAADGSVTSLALLASKEIYKFEGTRQSLQVNIPLDQEPILPKFTPQVQQRIFSSTQAASGAVKNMALGRYVAVIERRGATDDSFQILGWDSGLTLTASELNITDKATAGTINVTLATSDEESGEEYPYRVWVETDYSTTQTALNGKLAS